MSELSAVVAQKKIHASFHKGFKNKGNYLNT